jgi:MshEN domain
MSVSMKSVLPELTRPWSKMRAVCALRECHNKQFASWIPGTLPGIQVGSQWYCCVDCFVLAARTPLELLSSRHVLEIQRQPRLSLSLFLVSKGHMSSEQMREVNAQCENNGEDLESALIRRGMVNEKQLAAARSAQWGYPVFSPEQAGQWVEADLPLSLLKAFRAVPLHYSATANRILVGFATRVDPQVLELIERLTSIRVEPCFITPNEWEEQMERVTAAPDYHEIFVDEPGTPEKMARTVGRAAVKVAAREALFIQCKDYILVHLTGKRGRADVIFHTRRPVFTAIHKNFEEIAEAVAVTG